MNRASKAGARSKLLRFFPTPSSTRQRRALLHFSTEKPSHLRPLHHVDGDQPSSPVSQIVEILKNQDDGKWKSDPQLSLLLSTSPPLSAHHFLRITRHLPSSNAALKFVQHLSSIQYQLEPGSLSAAFQAVFELASREPSSLDKLWRLVERSKEMGFPLSINSATLLLRRFSKSVARSMAVYNAVEPNLRNLQVRNLLLDVLFRCGCFGEAVKLLDEMLEPKSEVSANDATGEIVFGWIWRSIKGVDGVNEEEIVNLLMRLSERGLFLDSQRLRQLITEFSRKGKSSAAWDLLHCYVKLGVLVDVSCYNSLLQGLVKKGELKKINLLIKEMKESGSGPTVFTFGILIKQLCKSGRMDESLEMLKKMREEGVDGIPVQPDVVIYNMIINGFCKLGRLEQGLALMEKMKLEGHCLPNTATYNSLIDGFNKAGEVKKSLELFDMMKKEGVEPNAITINALIDGMCKHDRINSALKFFNEMKDKGIDGDEKTYTSLISAFCSAGNINKAMQLFDEMKDKCEPDAIVYYTLILGFCQAGRMDDASSVMSLMRNAGFHPDIACYNAAISGFCKRKKLDRAYELLKEMEMDKVRPDCVTYNTLISYFSKTGDFKSAHTMLERMIEEGIMPTVVTYGALIYSYCLAGDLDEAMKIFNKMSSGGRVLPNTVIYNSLIEAHCKNKEVEAALSLFDDMNVKGLKPNANTFNSIFRGLSDINWLDKALELMDVMTCQGCDPDYITIEILTGWLSAVGETDRLRKFVRGFQVCSNDAEC